MHNYKIKLLSVNRIKEMKIIKHFKFKKLWIIFTLVQINYFLDYIGINYRS